MKRFIDDSFGITKGDRKDVIYWIQKFNELRKTVQIDKYNWGTARDYMDLFIKMMTYKLMYMPSCFVSFHQQQTIKNTVWGELKRYVRYNLEEKIFKKLRSRLFLSLRNNGIKKYIHTKLFQHVTYSQRDKLLNTELPLPNVCEPLII